MLRRVGRRRGIAVATSILLACCLDARADWTAGRGDAAGSASAVWTGTNELREWHYTWKTERRFRTGVAIWASPALAVVKGKPMAFIGGCDQTLHALDLADKRVAWRRMTNAEIGSAPVVGEVAGRAVVFVASNDRTVYALDPLTGTTLWTRELEPASPTLGECGFASPLLFKGRLYVAGFAYDRSLARNRQVSRLYILDPLVGQLLGQVPVGSGFVSDPVGFEAGGRSLVAVASRRGLLQVFDVGGQSPVPAWSYQMPHEVLGSPVVEMGTKHPILVLGSKYGNLIALDGSTGRERWKRMAGNWFDNAACIGRIDGTNVVFAGSYDYQVYALRAADGALLWKRPLGGEVYSAPAFFQLDGRPAVAVAALDNHAHILDARTGAILTSYYTGRPVWDKVSKGDTLWGSPAALEAGPETVLVHGSYNESVYVLPLARPCTLQARARSAKGLWISLGIVGAMFCGVVLPWVLKSSDNG